MYSPVKQKKFKLLFKAGIKIKLIRSIKFFDFVCFMGDYMLTGFGRDQAVKRCVTWGLGSCRFYSLGISNTPPPFQMQNKERCAYRDLCIKMPTCSGIALVNKN
jgi:hypothetical protein